MNNWKDKIATMILVKQELMKQDVVNIWRHEFRVGVA
ncbi:SMI1/KNR4 family protein, partial [Bacillus thuringiensis]|nr:SMI1/KNR4 family protein [Bacillus thuringiensis]